ncbi:hypothetical protein [Ignatzschineria sp. LJL83]
MMNHYLMKAVGILVLVSMLYGCDLDKAADSQFGDQHFKTAIALIELHKVRTGDYPDTLSQLQYVGDWDQIALTSVRYKRLREGYELDITKGFTGTPELKYDAGFWKGLGIKKTNVKSL